MLSTPLPRAALREEAESPSWGATEYLGVGHTYLYLLGAGPLSILIKGLLW